MENQNNRSSFSCTCEKCGRTLYEGEMLNIKGKFVCENCADSYVFSERPRKKRSAPSPFFHFCVSFMPGAGQMHLGLMKRGLFQMCLFFFSIYMTATIMPEFFGLSIPIIVLYSFFDSLSLRRKIASGEEVSDDLTGVSQFFSRNRRLIILMVIIMMTTGVLSSLIDALNTRVIPRPSIPEPPTVSISADAYEAIREAREEAIEEINQAFEHAPVYYERPRNSFFRSFFSTALIIAGGIIIITALKNKSGRTRDIVEVVDDTDVEVVDMRNSK